MKNLLTKRIITLHILLLILILSLVFINQPVLASENLQVVGNDAGLEVIPHDELLFNEMNMNPGDLVESKITITNHYKEAFKLYLRAERLDKEPINKTNDLYDQLLMTIRFRGREIFGGPIKNFATKNGILLGNFRPGEIQNLDVQVHLPGAQTGNKYMGLTLHNKWIFTAQRDPNNLPKTGGTPVVLYYILGSAFVTIGIVLKIKNKPKVGSS